MKPFVLMLAAACAPLACPAPAAVPDAAAASKSDAVQLLAPADIWPNSVPDLADWPGLSPVPVEETVTQDGQYIFNVTRPTVQALLPPAGRSTGAGVIIAPGGGFRFLSIRSEGTDVARWLAAHGVAAFVPRYRLVQNATIQMKRPASLTTPDEILGEPGVADGMQALRFVRANAGRYGIDPARLGAMGFSAGGHVVAMMGLAANPEERPTFSAPIYGGPFTRIPPKLPPAHLPNPPGTPADPWLAPPSRAAPGALPPFFLAFAQDDRAAGGAVRSFYDLLFAAGYRPEVHYYVGGGHGFGMKGVNRSSEHFIDEFFWWMETIGMLTPKAAPGSVPPAP
jgi:acetyl esterase/lipase